MKANFVKLPDFIGSAVDFGALASATNLCKMLLQDGCRHIEGMQERDLGGLGELGLTSRGVRRSVRHFMNSFWVKFGRAEARSMVEARRAEVCFSMTYCFLLMFYVVCLFTCVLVLSCRRHRKWRPHMVLPERILRGQHRRRLRRPHLLLLRRRLRGLLAPLLMSQGPGNLRLPLLNRRCNI